MGWDIIVLKFVRGNFLAGQLFPEGEGGGGGQN
jgi:hypothetical protein